MNKAKNKKKSANKNCLPAKRGSILAYALIILAMMLSIASAMSFVTVIEKKSATATDSSVQAYQTSDSGLQMALKKINSNLNNKLSDIYPTCSSGTVSNITDAGMPSGASYKLTFYNKSGVLIGSCTTYVNTIGTIKSTGTYQGTVRAISVGVDASWLSSSACPTFDVYKADVAGNPQWETTTNACANPTVCSGASPNVNLLASNTPDFTAYPARQACKLVGGRLPTVTELGCIYANRASFGTFQSQNYWSSGENATTTNANIVSFATGASSNASKTTATYYTRCVK